MQQQEIMPDVAEDPLVSFPTWMPYLRSRTGSQTPYVVRGARKSYPAVEKWTSREYLEENLPEMVKSVGRTAYSPKPGAAGTPPSAVFVYWDGTAPMNNLTSVSALRHKVPEITMMEPKPFVEAIYNDNEDRDKKKHYMSAKWWNFGKLMEDVRLEDLTVNSQTRDAGNFTGSKVKANFWMGEDNVVTHLHFDWSHNFHTQIVGRKDILLIPAEAVADIYPYPYPHPRQSKSQVPLRLDNSKMGIGNGTMTIAYPVTALRFNRALKAGARFVRLYPGDVLYIPPLWAHHVVTVDAPTISASVWTEDAASFIEDDAFAVGPPAGFAPTKDGKVGSEQFASASVATYLLAERVLRPNVEEGWDSVPGGIDGVFGPKCFLKQLIESRWDLLADAVPELDQGVNSWRAAGVQCHGLTFHEVLESQLGLKISEAAMPRIMYVPPAPLLRIARASL